MAKSSSKTRPAKLLADQLRELLTKSGRSDYSIAEEAEVDGAVISRFRRGLRDVTLETAGRLAEVLGAELVVTRRRVKAARRARAVSGLPTTDDIDPELN